MALWIPQFSNCTAQLRCNVKFENRSPLMFDFLDVLTPINSKSSLQTVSSEIWLYILPYKKDQLLALVSAVEFATKAEHILKRTSSFPFSYFHMKMQSKPKEIDTIFSPFLDSWICHQAGTHYDSSNSGLKKAGPFKDRGFNSRIWRQAWMWAFRQTCQSSG